jgi:hypothetical protein
MFGPKIKLDRELYERLKECATIAGYSSAREFAAHVLEREVERLTEGEADEEEVKRRLKGLGYMS